LEELVAAMQAIVHLTPQYSCKWVVTGKVVNYIPERTCVAANQLGICIAYPNGNAYKTGRTMTAFTIQSFDKWR